MRYGFVLPGGSATEQVELAVLADQTGWDGVFMWEAAYGVDPWTGLAAVAARTSRIRLGTMLTPLPWRRPWKLASQVVTLDQISNGRAILAVGLGAVDAGLGATGEQLDRRVRAEMLDEGVDLILGLWQGRLQYAGRHYTLDLTARTDLGDTAQPVQQPHPPLWIVGGWPRMKSMRRVLRGTGLLPNVIPFRELTPDDARAMRGWLTEQGARADFDLITEGETPADDRAKAAEIVKPWIGAGCTWWLETRWGNADQLHKRLDRVRERIAAGPPRD